MHLSRVANCVFRYPEKYVDEVLTNLSLHTIITHRHRVWIRLDLQKRATTVVVLEARALRAAAVGATVPRWVQTTSGGRRRACSWQAAIMMPSDTRAGWHAPGAGAPCGDVAEYLT